MAKRKKKTEDQSDPVAPVASEPEAAAETPSEPTTAPEAPAAATPAEAEPTTLSQMAKAEGGRPPRGTRVEPIAAGGVRVRATETGFHRGDRKRAGAEFSLRPGEKPAKWMEVISK